MRRFSSSTAVAAVTVFLAAMLAASSANGMTIREDIGYGPHPDQVLDLYLPDQAGPRPAVVILHGGGWTGGDQKIHAGTARRFAERGFVVVSATYRKDHPPVLPYAHLDAEAVLAWLERRATEHRVDRGRIAAWGDSAGGHLALMLGARARVAAVVAWSPPTDLTAFSYLNPALGFDAPSDYWRTWTRAAVCDERDAQTVVVQMNGISLPCPPLLELMSPARQISAASAPVFLSYFEVDAVDYREQGLPLIDAAARHGVEVVSTVTAGPGHGVSPSEVGPSIAWLDQKLGL